MRRAVSACASVCCRPVFVHVLQVASRNAPGGKGKTYCTQHRPAVPEGAHAEHAAELAGGEGGNPGDLGALLSDPAGELVPGTQVGDQSMVGGAENGGAGINGIDPNAENRGLGQLMPATEQEFLQVSV